MASVEALLTLPDDIPDFPNATIHVRLLDVSLADAPAVEVAETVIDGVSVKSGDTIAVIVDVPDNRIRQDRHYVIRAHIDAGRNARVTKGDCVSTRSHPVLSFGNPATVSVPLRYLR